MLRQHWHPSDETLLRAIDAELSVKRKMALDGHLRRCDRCRLRLSAFESVGDEATRLYRIEISQPMVNLAALRERIQAEMADVGAKLDRSLWFRARQALATLPLAARVAASLALVVLVLQLVRPASRMVTRQTPPAPIAADGLPIHALTPGAAVNVSLEALCAGRPVVIEPIPSSLRQAVLRQYRMEHLAEHEYELDYLITPELGGVADQRNLWPERYEAGVWNARVKDDLEELLPQLVCQGTVALATAQRDIAHNWIAAYKKYFRTDRPIAKQAGDRNDDDYARPGHRRSTVTALFVSARPTPVVSPRLLLFASRNRMGH